MAKRLYYAWFEARMIDEEWRLSREPPDAPVRPSYGFASMADLTAWAQRKRIEVGWYPPLTPEQQRRDGMTLSGL
jgi:hypothetical protein